MILGPKINKNGEKRQNENFPKNGVWSSLYPLMPFNFMQNIKKNMMSLFWAIYKKVDFWTKNQQKWRKSAKWEFFWKMVPSNFMRNMKKSNETILSNIQKSWFFPTAPPTFGPKSRKREFSQIWDLHRKLANHKTLHFRSFLAKTNDSIFAKV